MGLAAQYLSAALWREWIVASDFQMGYAAFALAVLQVVFINIVLSGDNAVVIALACRGLPQRQRRWGMAIGAGVAVALLIVFAGLVAWLMQLAFLKLIGGAALLYIGAKLVVPEQDAGNDVTAAKHLWHAVGLVVVADIVMSLDNVIAVAAVAQGRFPLIAIGLAVSIPLIVAGAALLAAFLDRLPILVWLGAALLGFIAGETIATDPAVAHWTTALGDPWPQRIEFAAAGSGALLALGAGGLWRSLRENRGRSDVSSGDA